MRRLMTALLLLLVTGTIALRLGTRREVVAEELSAVIPGFAPAMAWPDAELAVC